MLLGPDRRRQRNDEACAACPVPARRSEALARVGAIVEEPHFHSHLSGLENMQIARPRCAGPETFARIEGALGPRRDGGPVAGEKVSRYSQGMRQRLGVARCLLAEPGAADPRRADQRARSRRDPRVPPDDPRARRRGSHRLPLLASARRGREGVRRGGDHRDEGRIITLRGDRGPHPRLEGPSSSSNATTPTARSRLLAGVPDVLGARALRRRGCVSSCARRGRLALSSTGILVEDGIAVSRLDPGPRARSRSASSPSPRAWRAVA